MLNKPAVLFMMLAWLLLPWMAGERPSLSRYSAKKFSIFPRWAVALTAAVLFLSWAQAVLPPTGNDALAYHLEHPKWFVLNGKIGPLLNTRESMWPYFTEMLFTLGLLLQGTALAQLFHWVFYPLTACGVYLLARRLYGPAAGLSGALVFIFTPAAFAQSGHAYVDLSLAFFTLMAVYPLFFDETRRGRVVWPLLSGLMAGTACGTKYLGLGTALVLFFLWAVRTRTGIKPLLFFVLGALLTGGIWYLRSWLALGNPFYPFFAERFGGHGYELHVAEGVGMGGGPLDFILLLWRMTLHPAPFGGEMLGPFFLILLPLLLFVTRRPSRDSVFLALFTFCYAAFLFTQSQQTRFYLSVVPFLSVGCGYVLWFLWKQDRFARLAAKILFFSVVLLHLGVFIYRARDAWQVFFGRQSSEKYLATHERSFVLYSFLAKNAMPGQKILISGEPRRFFNFYPGTVFDDAPLRADLKKDGRTFKDYFEEQGFDLIALGRGAGEDVREAVEARGGYDEIYAYSFREGGVDFDYRIYKRAAII